MYGLIGDNRYDNPYSEEIKQSTMTHTEGGADGLDWRKMRDLWEEVEEEDKYVKGIRGVVVRL